MAVLEGEAVSYEQGTPVAQNCKRWSQERVVGRLKKTLQEEKRVPREQKMLKGHLPRRRQEDTACEDRHDWKHRQNLGARLDKKRRQEDTTRLPRQSRFDHSNPPQTFLDACVRASRALNPSFSCIVF